MTLKSVIIISLSLMLVGCEKHIIPGDVEREVEEVISKLGTGMAVSRWCKLNKKINAYTNDVTRLVCYKYVFEKTHAIRFVKGDYKRQAIMFDEINSNASFEPAGGPYLGLKMEEIYALYLQHLTWMRDQIEVWRPKRSIDIVRLSTEEQREWRSWRDSYRSCMMLYVAMIAQLERRVEMYCSPDKVGETEKSRIKKMITDFLGRPIHSKEQTIIDQQSVDRSDEMKAVRQGKISP